MVAAFDSWAIEHSAVRDVLVHDLTLEYAAVLQREIEDVAVGCIRHRIELHDRHCALHVLQRVPNASEIPMTTVQTPDTAERFPLRHLGHTNPDRCKSRT